MSRISFGSFKSLICKRFFTILIFSSISPSLSHCRTSCLCLSHVIFSPSSPSFSSLSFLVNHSTNEQGWAFVFDYATFPFLLACLFGIVSFSVDFFPPSDLCVRTWSSSINHWFPFGPISHHFFFSRYINDELVKLISFSDISFFSFLLFFFACLHLMYMCAHIRNEPFFSVVAFLFVSQPMQCNLCTCHICVRTFESR